MNIEHSWCADLNCPRFADGTCDNNKYSQKNVCEMYNKILNAASFDDHSKSKYGYDDETLSKLRELGIVQCISKLKDTNFAPASCMTTLHKKLFFMGVSGAKWVENQDNKKTI